MNKTLKGIIGGSVLLAALGAALAALLLTKPETEEESSHDHTGEVELWHVSSDAINRITVENPNGDSYSAFRRKETVNTTDMEGNAVQQEVSNYYLEGYEDLPMNTTGIRLLATRSPEVTSTGTVLENASDAELAQYGLDNPVKVTYEVDDSDDVTFLIGKLTPIDNNRYLCMEGGNTVYTVSAISLEPFFDGILDYLGKTLKEEQADGDDTLIKSVRIERSDLDYDFSFIFDPYYEENSNGGAMALHVMEEPVYALLSADKSVSATHGLYGLTADEVLTPFPSAAEKKNAGFDDPFVTVTMKTDDGKTTKFYLGGTYQTEDGSTRYYGMLDGLDCIYGFAPATIAYDDLKPEDIISRNIIDVYVWDIGSLTYQAGGLKLAFEGKGEDQDDFVMTMNGESLDDSMIERYRKLYTYLLQTSAEEIVYDQPEMTGEPLASVVLERQDGKRTYHVDYYDAGNMKAYIVVDGDVRFRCRRSYVDNLISNLEIFEDLDQDFTTTW